MIPIDQTRFGLPGGNCFQACLASILELPLAEVPDAANADLSEAMGWFRVLRPWLALRGLGIVVIAPGQPSIWFTQGAILIAGGKSPRAPDHPEGYGHCVVMRNGTVLHDPHPSRAGLHGEPEEYYILYALDPARHAAASGEEEYDAQ